jgi:N-methylhydantoinase A
VQLDPRLAAEAVGELARSLDLEPMACAEGIVKVANAEMVRALRVVSVERGVDPRRYALLAFGGAGPLHAPAIADELGITEILCPAASGVLAALGLVVSPRRRDAQRTVLLSGEEFTRRRVSEVVEELARAGREALRNGDAEVAATYELRYRGQAFELPVEAGPGSGPEELRKAFEALHEERYGYRDPDQEVELVTIRVSSTVPGAEVELAGCDSDPASGRRGGREAVFNGERLELETLRGLPEPGTSIAAPAVVELSESTVLVAPGWTGQVDRTGTMRLSRDEQGDSG